MAWDYLSRTGELGLGKFGERSDGNRTKGTEMALFPAERSLFFKTSLRLSVVISSSHVWI